MILVIGLDGLDPDVLARLRSAGQLPNLAALADAGASGLLRSSFPPVSVPAWSTFLTGVGPGQHGLFDFTRLESPTLPGAARVRFQNGSDRRVPTLLELADRAGRRVCSIGVPTTYPVPHLERGAVLAGFDSPFLGRPDPDALHPPALWRELAAQGLDLRASTLPEGRKGRGWHRRAARELLESVRRRLTQARRLLESGPWDLLLVHFQASDTAGHHFFRYYDAASPRHDATHPDRSRVIPDVYDALDDAVGELRRSLADDSLCVVLSDHGMGAASERVIHLNRWLEQQGLLVRRSSARARPAALARRVAVGWLPPELQAALFRRLRSGVAAGVETALRLGEIDFERSLAFSEESSTLPGIWLLDPERRDEVIARLRGWQAVRRVYRREDIYRGPARTQAPDLLLELRHPLLRTPPGYRGDACRALEAAELDGERGGALNGVHRPDGVILAAGPSVAAGSALEGAWIGDLAPTLLAALQVPVPEWMEGQPLTGLAPRPRFSSEPPLRRASGPAPRLSARQSARLERRLRAMGYLG
jgi:predicted AlkP superfamily phosphohydrolase/phosphomutase